MEGNMAAVKRILAEGRADVNCRVKGLMCHWWTGSVTTPFTSPVMEEMWRRLTTSIDNTLHFACNGGDVETVEFVLSLNVVDINSRGVWSWTPVMTAAERGHREVVKLLVSEGADVSLVDVDGDNILHYAFIRGDVATVKFVLSLNVVDIDARNNIGLTAADMARLGGHKEVVKLLEPCFHVM
ncbi:E3 ubiquitin-protein ligase mind-bomb-like [Haliotis rufescens]|uniref:E3 ubiquitin-protein ligase mind-bomb-like n=1 Tax=Haliotis rufescens TaxID=6454 RepID=UPI00201ECC70|nr:E3 ubiquitin-protein ligase mind-bomb-like [Haliotis rufescens]